MKKVLWTVSAAVFLAAAPLWAGPEGEGGCACTMKKSQSASKRAADREIAGNSGNFAKGASGMAS